MTACADAETLALYEAALDRLPPLSCVVFLLHRVDELSYVEIAERLSIMVAAVEACIVEALLVICATVDGREHRQRPLEVIAEAEAALHERHRRACGDFSRESGGGIWRMVHSIRQIGRRRPTFETWLCNLVGR
ncbi:sigma factor-like helix-turn-helix DNA-binding protein [Sphingobium olei]|uniref:Sigma factor-like helix-turn-helix DNA-binding protein n=1 Tax=Sphingobium olei TaxID=420955 RepID=A0ABW3NV21_9SPHN